MKKTSKILFAIIAFALLTITFTPVVHMNQPVVAEAATKVGKITGLSNWKEVELYGDGDGVDYRITWKKVKGVTGYQVKEYEKEDPSEKWWSQTVNTKRTRYDVQFSSLYAFQAKVRAYKTVNGKTYYGPWSKIVKKTVY